MTRPAALRRRPTGGFTLVEMVVVIVLIALLAAWSFGRFTGQSDGADNSGAQTTASGALDAINQEYLISGGAGQFVPLDGPGCTVPAANTARKATDRAGVDPTVSGTVQKSGAGYDMPDPTDPSALTTPTNCPAFANPTGLTATNGDIKLSAGDKASTGPDVASIEARLTTTGWEVGVAVLAKTGANPQVGTCWLATRMWPRAGVADTVSDEAYFSAQSTDDSGTVPCTGFSALAETLDSVCLHPHVIPNDPSSREVAPYGTSWNRVCPQYGPRPS